MRYDEVVRLTTSNLPLFSPWLLKMVIGELLYTYAAFGHVNTAPNFVQIVDDIKTSDFRHGKIFFFELLN